MAIHEFQCQRCGYIVEEIFLPREEISYDTKCDICSEKTWKHIISAHVVSAQVNKDNNKWPYLGHVRDPQTGERPVFESRAQQEEWMKRNGYVYHDPDFVGVQGSAGSRSPDLQRVLDSHPAFRKYMDQMASGRIPQSKFLTEEELKEKFDVPVQSPA